MYKTYVSILQWCWSGDLRKGKYKIIPFVTGCFLQYKEEDCDDVKLTREDNNGDIQLTNKFKFLITVFFHSRRGKPSSREVPPRSPW